MYSTRHNSIGLPVVVILVFLFIGLNILPSCSKNPPRSPNVVLVVLDTVRADHMSLYGYERDTTPVMAGLADSATVYRRARATSPWTLPSHASMFTGAYPYEHGAHTVWVDLPRSRGSKKKRSKDPHGLIDNVRPLSPVLPTLAEVFAKAGYRTAAIGANTVYLDEEYGLSRGFETYDMRYEYHRGLNRRIGEWLDTYDGERPFFLFLNYMDAHTPYNNSPVRGLLESIPPPNRQSFMNDISRQLMGDPDAPLPEEKLDVLTDQYDLGIANLDKGIGDLIGMLREQGIYDDLLLVITSDHGEYLGGHRLIEHSKDVYEPALNIPLLVKAPRQKRGAVEESLVSLVHIPRIIMRHVDRVDVKPFPRDEPGEIILAENHFTRWKDLLRPWGKRFHRKRYVLYRDNLKLILSSDGDNELYDLAEDPRETSNLFSNRKKAAEELAAELRRRLELGPDDLPAIETREYSEDELRRLKSLGYL